MMATATAGLTPVPTSPRRAGYQAKAMAQQGHPAFRACGQQECLAGPTPGPLATLFVKQTAHNGNDQWSTRADASP